jgi:hypothetical protein
MENPQSTPSVILLPFFGFDPILEPRPVLAGLFSYPTLPGPFVMERTREAGCFHGSTGGLHPSPQI